MIGVGNVWRGDDGAGPAVAAALGGEVTESPLRVIELWAGTRHAIVVDAACSGAPAGTIHHFDASARPLEAGATRHSTHAFGLADAIEVARMLDRLPARLDVYAIEGSDFTLGSTLSPPVARAVQTIARELRAGDVRS